MWTNRLALLFTLAATGFAWYAAPRLAGQERRIRPAKSSEANSNADSGRNRKAPPKKKVTTVIFVELLTGDEGVGLQALHWTRVFEKLDVTLTIRRGTSFDKPGVTEKKTADTVRSVHLIGKLDRRGRLVFDDRVYGDDDIEKLSEWIAELREFGAQGTPEGKPVWGLTRQQFGTVHAALSQPLADEPRDRELADALKLWKLPDDLSLRLTESTASRLKQQSESVGRQSLKGISQGTALAILLSDQGLGFLPRRRSDGVIEISVMPLEELREPWPVGWPREKSGPETAPKLFSLVPIELSDIELDAVLDAAAQVVGVPILVDRRALAEKEIDLAQVKVSHPAKRTTWSLALGTLLFKAKAKFELLIDEAGRPFLWVTPVAVPRRPLND